ncbi:MAG: hypothetical protein ACREFD_00010 [Stellaceae bacterium]
MSNLLESPLKIIWRIAGADLSRGFAETFHPLFIGNGLVLSGHPKLISRIKRQFKLAWIGTLRDIARFPIPLR